MFFMQKRGVLILLLLLLPIALADCHEPTNLERINSSVTLCNDVFYLNNGINLEGNNVTLDCAGAIIQGKYKGAGITIEGKDITVKNCRILNYDTAFLATNSSRVFLLDNHLIRNYHSTSFIHVTDSAIHNYDISLKVPIYIKDTTSTILSSLNRFFEQDFCSNNYCNRPRHVIEFHMLKKDDPKRFQFWFLKNLLTADGLRSYILDSLTYR